MAKKTKENKSVRCADCRHTQPLGDYTIRCTIHKVGKVRNSPRPCDYFEAK